MKSKTNKINGKRNQPRKDPLRYYTKKSREMTDFLPGEELKEREEDPFE